jgi:flagellar protein FlbD
MVPVISLTRFNGQRFALNPDLIERVEATPDTVITLVDGSRQVVVEDIDEVVAKVQHHRAAVVALSQRMDVVLDPTRPYDAPTVRAAAPSLRIVDGTGGDA